ncbi:MAG: hypothetical protein QOJ64_3153 [Acidobacteriota bacterium]|jgi:uncharacterized protein YndB with AHSA1/START domain|nr:hypothetical protein [Acidobacteriota bacterium]
MPDVIFDFPINAPRARVFQAVATPEGLDSRWTKRSSGEPTANSEYVLWFGPEYDWRAVVSRVTPDAEFELQLTSAQEDSLGTRVGFVLEESGRGTKVRFHHLGWPEENDHYRSSSYCWAMYLRLLVRCVERGDVVDYDHRLEA